MKKFFFLAAAVAGLLSFESCKKCGTCTVFSVATPLGVKGAELCGDNYTLAKDAAVYSDSTKFGTKCTDK